MYAITLVITGWSGTPFCLCTDGDLLSCIHDMVRYRSRRSVRVSKVKGHATDAMVAEGTVRREDKEGNDAADIAADFDRLRQPEVVVDARRDLLRSGIPESCLCIGLWWLLPGSPLT